MTNKLTDTKEIARLTRVELKKRFPEYKFSVTFKWFSGGSSMDVALMSGPDNPFIQGGERGYVQINHYNLDDYLNNDSNRNRTVLTKKAVEMLKEVSKISNVHNWDNSDSMIDYFDVNYYCHLNIGKWDKPYQVK